VGQRAASFVHQYKAPQTALEMTEEKMQELQPRGPLPSINLTYQLHPTAQVNTPDDKEPSIDSLIKNLDIGKK